MKLRTLLMWGLPAFALALIVASPLQELDYQSRRQAGWTHYEPLDRPNWIWECGIASLISDIGFDRQGRLWLVEDCHGLSILDAGIWSSHMVGEPGVAAGTLDNLGRVWLATDGGVSVLDDQVWTTYTRGISSGYREIAVDRNGRAWIGTTADGVFVLDGNTWTNYTPENSGLGDEFVCEIAFDSQDRVWVGTVKGGVSVFDGHTWTTYGSEDSHPLVCPACAIAIDHEDRAWIGTGCGVSVLDRGAWAAYTHENSGLASDSINAIAVDDQDRVWIGTYAGASVFDGVMWKTYTEENSGLPFNDADAIAVDRSGQVAISDGRQVSLLAPQLAAILPPSTLFSRNIVFAADIRWIVPSLLILLWLGVLLSIPLRVPLALLALCLVYAILNGGWLSTLLCPHALGIIPPVFPAFGAFSAPIIVKLVDARRAKLSSHPGRVSRLAAIVGAFAGLGAYGVSAFLSIPSCIG